MNENRSNALPQILVLFVVVIVLLLALLPRPPLPKITPENVAQLIPAVTLRTNSTENQLIDFVYENDTVLATDSSTMYLWQLDTGATEASISNQDGGYTLSVFFVQGQPNALFITWDQNHMRRENMDGSLENRRWDTPFGVTLEYITRSADGRRVVVGNRGWMGVFNVESGTRLLQVGTPDARVPMYFVTALSDDGRFFATARRPSESCQCSELQVWDVDSGEQIALYEGFENVGSIDFSDDHTLIAISNVNYYTSQSHIQVWQLDSGSKIGEFTAQHPSGYFTHLMELSPDNDYLGMQNVDPITLWKLTDAFQGGTPIMTTEYGAILSTFGYRSMDFNPDGSLFAASLGQGGAIAVFNTYSGLELARFDTHDLPVNTVRFSDDGRLLMTMGYDNTIILWALEDRWPEIRQVISETLPELSLAPISP